MKLNSHQRPIAMSHSCYGASVRFSEHVEALGNGFDLIAMVHPDLRVTVEVREKGVGLGSFEKGQAVFARGAFSHMAA
jgi:hypothetical protein